jgi:AraC-like DNA-binding protein
MEIFIKLLDNFIITPSMSLHPVLRKKEGFAGQLSIVLPRKILTDLCIDNPLTEKLYVTDLGYYPKAQHHYRQRTHGSDQHILIYCVEGNGSARIKKKDHRLVPGSFVIIPAGEQHSYAAGEDHSWTIYWVHFKGSLSSGIVDALIRKTEHFHGSVEFQPRRIELFEDMYACLERGYSNDNISYANVCLYHYISSFIYADKFHPSGNRPPDDAVELSINYMRKNITQSLTLEKIARSVNFSASHYSALFRKKTGFAPIEYFNHLKIQKACQYLLYTDLRIKEIADKLGIEDPYYFSRMFAKLMGQSPIQYRSRR